MNFGVMKVAAVDFAAACSNLHHTKTSCLEQLLCMERVLWTAV
jgi:hypothetical protein